MYKTIRSTISSDQNAFSADNGLDGPCSLGDPLAVQVIGNSFSLQPLSLQFPLKFLKLPPLQLRIGSPRVQTQCPRICWRVVPPVRIPRVQDPAFSHSESFTSGHDVCTEICGWDGSGCLDDVGGESPGPVAKTSDKEIKFLALYFSDMNNYYWNWIHLMLYH